MIFRPSWKKIDNEFCFIFDDHKIINEKVIKYLGVIFDEQLRWTYHILSLKTKLSRINGVMYNLRNYCNKSTLRMIYYSLAYSHLIYGILAWGCATPTAI